MSKQKDNHSDDSFEDFLSANNGGSNSPLDDFDKEALEGFSLINDKNELWDLKQETDKKVFEALSQNNNEKTGAIISGAGTNEHEPKKNRYMWLAAAAGLALMISLSVYFVLINSKNEAHTIALNKSEKDPVPNPPIEQLTDKQPAPSEPSAQGNPNAKPQTESFKNITITSQSKVSSSDNYSKSNEGEKIVVNEEPLVLAEKEIEEKKHERDEPDHNASLAAAPKAAKSQDQEMAEADKDKIREDLKNPEQTEVVVKETLASRKKRTKDEKPSKQEQSARTSPAGAPSQTDDVRPVYASNTNFNDQLYEGGYNVFLADLKKELIRKNLDFGLSGSIVIATNGKVEKVSITESSLSQEQQERVTKIIKEMRKFKKPETGTAALFNFSYRP